MTISIVTAGTWITKGFITDRWFAFAERITDEWFLARTHWISCGVANRTDAAWTRVTWVLWFDATTDGIRRLNVTRKARAL